MDSINEHTAVRIVDLSEATTPTSGVSDIETTGLEAARTTDLFENAQTQSMVEIERQESLNIKETIKKVPAKRKRNSSQPLLTESVSEYDLITKKTCSNEKSLAENVNTDSTSAGDTKNKSFIEQLAFDPSDVEDSLLEIKIEMCDEDGQTDRGDDDNIEQSGCSHGPSSSAPPLPQRANPQTTQSVLHSGHSSHQRTRGRERTSGGQERTSKGREQTSGGQERTSKRRKQTSGGQERTSKGREQTSGGQERTSKGREQTSGGQERTSKRREQTSGGQERTSKGREQTSGEQERTSKGREQTVKKRIADAKRRTTGMKNSIKSSLDKTREASLRPAGEEREPGPLRAPGGTLYGTPDLKPEQFRVDEMSEAMEADDEEAEAVMGRGGELLCEVEVYPYPGLLEPSNSAGAIVIGDASGAVRIPRDPHCVGSAVDVSPAVRVAPSVSGVTVRREENEGSELDSEFDDEFDGFAIESAPLIAGRDIPEDEELEEPVRAIIRAVEQAMDDEADRLVGTSNVYTWVRDFDTFEAVPEQFTGPNPGPIKDYDTPYDAFTDIWSMDIIEHIARETNRYAKQTIDKEKAKETLKATSRLHLWYDTDADEILLFMGVLMYMALDTRSSQNEYWMANDYLELAKFKELLSYNRFILLNKFLHFVDNSDASPSELPSGGTKFNAKLANIQPVISHLNQKFSSLYNLSKNLSIDESLTLFKGRLSWVQAIRSKAARFGIKSFELCESHTGYLYRFQIYTGSESGKSRRRNKGRSDAAAAPDAESQVDSQSEAESQSESDPEAERRGPSESADTQEFGQDLAGKSTNVVLALLKGLERRGHCVTMDNYYNCPALARYLKSLKFDCVGTLRKNRRNVPEDIARLPKRMEKGKIVARHCGDVSVVAWADSRVVVMISTYHNAETYLGSRAGLPLRKPIVVRDYNNTMGGVDLKDQNLSMYLLERKRCVKWYKKIFKRLLNVSIHNAFVMHAQGLKRRGESPLTHREFRYALAKSLVDRHRRSQPRVVRHVAEDLRLRTDVMHVPKYLAGSSNRKRCVVCIRRRIKNKLVRTLCTTCKEYMCFEKCWIDWHSLPNLPPAAVRGRKRTRKH